MESKIAHWVLDSILGTYHDIKNVADLRPESWLMASDTDNAINSLASLFRRRKQPVTDTAVWVQCYSSLVSVLVELYPQFIKHFMAYLYTIAMGAKRMRTLSWVAYDAAYRRKAAATKSLFWGTVDQYLHTVWFANQAMPPACITFFSTDHATDHCPANTAILVLGQAITANHQHASMLQPMPTQPLQCRCKLHSLTANAATPGAIPTLTSKLNSNEYYQPHSL